MNYLFVAESAAEQGELKGVDLRVSTHCGNRRWRGRDCQVAAGAQRCPDKQVHGMLTKVKIFSFSTRNYISQNYSFKL